MNHSKKAAMFGLDARVALAIFSALSVITGAALYNTIQEAKVVAIITEMNNIDKAFTEYLIDTRTYPEAVTSLTTGRLITEELLVSSVTGWKGPYISLPDLAPLSDGNVEHPGYGVVRTFRKVNTPWDQPGSSANACLSTSTDCSVYICYTEVPTENLKILDLKIDGTDSPDTGRFRHTGLNYGCKQGIPYDKTLAPSS
ncbi:MAG: hypothetical protein GY793_03230 [Proteobacteria bacterium]|nr:hypothetical protein [Pseudomonadota bacterium]